MNVLVDTSVWSIALRRRKQKLSSSLGNYFIIEELKASFNAFRLLSERKFKSIFCLMF